jgi:glycosyltransferase involved in cell wall biosynthesis
MILDREFPPDLRVENEMEALAGSGHEIHLACFTRKNLPRYEKTGTCQIHRKAIPGWIYKSSVGALVLPLYFNFWNRFLRTLFQKHTFDAIHVHDLPLSGVALRFSRDHNIPLTVDLHENWPAYLSIAIHTNTPLGKLLSPIKRWLDYEKKTLELADHIIVVVDEAADRLVGLGIEHDKIHVVSNTLNTDHFQLTEKKKTSEDINLFYAGGLNFHRGLQVVIRAMAGMPRNHPEFILQILGEGSYRKDLEDLARKLGIEKQVIFHGWKPYEEMTEMMMESDYALIPHLRSAHTDSTIPHKLFQYMYAGKPVIASDCEPIKRIVNETKSGYIYPSDRPDELADLLIHLRDRDPGTLGRNGREWVEKKYNWSGDSKVLISLYQQNRPNPS